MTEWLTLTTSLILFYRDDYPGSRNSYNNPPGDYSQGQGYNDNYGDPAEFNQSGYREGAPPPGGGNYHDPYYDDRQDSSFRGDPYSNQNFAPNGDDRYSDQQNNSLPPRHDDSFQRSDPRVNDSFQRENMNGPQGQYNQSFEQDRYPEATPRTRGSYDGVNSDPRFDPRYDQGQGQYEGEPGYGNSFDRGEPQMNGHDQPPPQYIDDYNQGQPGLFKFKTFYLTLYPKC